MAADKQNSENNQSRHNLEKIVDGEIFKQEKEHNIFKNAKQGFEKALFHSKNKVLVPACTALGGLTTYYAIPAMKNLASFVQSINPDSSLEGSAIGLGVTMGVLVGGGSYILLDDAVKDYIGKKICRVKEAGKKLKKKFKRKKQNFVYKNRVGLALASWAVTAGFLAHSVYKKISSLPLEGKQSVLENTDKLISGGIPHALGWLGAYYLFFHYIGRVIDLNNKDLWKSTLGFALSKISKKKALDLVKKKSRKDDIYADMLLARLEADADKRLRHQANVIQKIKKEKIFSGQSADWIKLGSIGQTYLTLKKEDPLQLINLAMHTYDLNPQRATTFFNKLSDSKELGKKPEVLAIRNCLLNMHENDTAKDWEEFFCHAKKQGKLKFLKSSKDKKVSAFKDRDFLKKYFIFKECSTNESDVFLIEKRIFEILMNTDISAEHPLYFYTDKDTGLQTQVFIRSGEKNLRESLENTGSAERRDVFKKILLDLDTYQKKVSSALNKNKAEWMLSSKYRGQSQNIVIPVLNPERNLMQRAFVGYNPGEERLGINDCLQPLLDKIYLYKQENHTSASPDLLAFNHGDLYGRNITEEFCFIDPRPKIASPVYDYTHLALEPAFLCLDFNSRKENTMEILMQNDGLHSLSLAKNYDDFFLHNAFCLAGAHWSRKNKNYTEAILNELIEFSKDKPFASKLKAYLMQSNAKEIVQKIYA